MNLEVELDSTLINDPERFHDRIRQVFRLAQQAIDDELNWQQGNGTPMATAGPKPTAARPLPAKCGCCTRSRIAWASTWPSRSKNDTA